MRDHLLAIDNGTQSVRALLFNLRGEMVAKSQVFLEPYFSRQPGWAEQNPEYYWSSVCQACQGLWAKSPVPKEAIAGVALTSQRATVINVDRQGKPLRPAIVWLDQRRTEGQPPIGGLWGLGFRVSRMRDTIAYIQAEAEANWLRTHEPDIWANTYKYLYLSGYLTYRLVDRFVDSTGCQVGFMPFDYKRQRWAADWDWKWRAVPMARNILVDLVQPGGMLGEISRAAAEATGIPARLPLIAAGADKACEVLGSGSLDATAGCISYGTTATITNLSTRYIEPIPLIPPYPAAVPHGYNLEVQIYRGFWMVSWFKKEFGQRELELAEEQGVAPEKLLDALVADAPPGAMGLVLQPYWTPGIKVPGPEAKGAVIGFGDVHTRAHLYRAILEGLAYGLREGKERLEKRTGKPISELRVSGGGSQSDAVMQLTADIFGLTALRPHVYETSGLGAAIDAAVGLKLHPDFPTAVREMTHVGQVFDPDPKTHELYEQLYRRVYLKLYERLKPLYQEIREITGYPVRS
ncbi:MAG: FGGY-family carbohydrate kinase [Anaerolineales bacterium]|nr:FGGY-family carbohydrate kinase [Anaerolineales bacterium]